MNSLYRVRYLVRILKAFPVLLLAALTLSGCSNNSKAAQVASASTWQAQLLGEPSGLSFNTQFTVNADGSLNIESFQFLTENPCFPVSGGSVAGTMILTINTSTDEVTGTFSYTVQYQSNTLTLTGTVTGTDVGSTFSNALVTGTWTASGSTSCTAVGPGSFTMSEQAPPT
jgi:hypothetical protein